jgi:UDP-N-acetylmuramate dehydrogenase
MQIRENVSLKPYNTFGLEAKARYFATINNAQEAITLLQNPTFKHKPLLILGGGSNMLLTQDFEGLVIKNEIKGIELLLDSADEVVVQVGAGENWHEFVLHAIAQGWGGIENLSLIPGTVGAAPMQNIGAYGVEIKEVFEELQALHLDSLQIHRFTAADCQFGYRESVFKNALKNQYLIVQVSFRLSKKPTFNTSYGAINDTLAAMGIQKLSIKAISDAVIHIRSSKLPNPAEIGNAGSFFKNPVIGSDLAQKLQQHYPDMPHYPINTESVKVPAAWLIEQCGWKGKDLGGYGVHDKQSLVLVNRGGATGQALKKLATEIQASVADRFGILLDMEVNLV